MPRNAPVVRRVEAQLQGLLSDGENIVFSVHGDVAADGSYGDRYLVGTEQQLFVLTPGSAASGNGHVALKLADIEELKAEPLVGSGMVSAMVGGRKVELLQYTNSRAADSP